MDLNLNITINERLPVNEAEPPSHTLSVPLRSQYDLYSNEFADRHYIEIATLINLW